MWGPCNVNGSLWGFWPSTFVHMGDMNFAFMDGHAQIFGGQSLIDHWLATDGAPYSPQTPADYGFHCYTYPPGLEATASLAQWWTVPWYPDGPFAENAIECWYLVP